jgi:ribosome-binding protein aMBF1 (putative translation factor)
MRVGKKRKLEAAGWRVGSVAQFLDLDELESALIELKIALGSRLRQRRVERGLTQVELARQLRSSQSRIAKMEAADRSVSIDLLVRSLLSLGASANDLARAVVSPAAPRT